METVLLLHGLFRTPLSMARLARKLRAEGYQVANWGYNSFASLPAIAKALEARLPELGQPQKLHGIGHSMGGLLLRHLFTKTPLPLGQLLLVGTPNQGASIVMHHNWLFRYRFMPQCIRDMRPDSPVIASWPVPNTRLGVVAGVEKFSPLNPASWLNRFTLGDEPHDGTVEVARVRLAEMHAYLEVKGNHSFLPSNPKVVAASAHFLRHGEFPTSPLA